jgi:hypothetical protein
VTYQSTIEEFNNPERGFLRFGHLTDPAKYAQIRRQGYSLAWAVARGDEFRNQPLSQAFLDTLQTGFNARSDGFSFAHGPHSNSMRSTNGLQTQNETTGTLIGAVSGE